MITMIQSIALSTTLEICDNAPFGLFSTMIIPPSNAAAAGDPPQPC